MLEFAAVLWLGSRASKAPRARRVSARFIACALVFSTLVGGQLLWSRLRNVSPLQFRREIGLSTLRMIQERPWQGFGLGTFATVYPAYALFDEGRAVEHAHSDWAEWTAEGGIPFAALLLVAVVLSLRPAVRSPWGLGVIAIFLHSLVDFPLRIPALAALTFVLLGALAATGWEESGTRRSNYRSRLRGHRLSAKGNSPEPGRPAGLESPVRS